MGKWVDVDQNGLHETGDYEDGKLVITKSEDVEPLLERNKELRATKATDIGIKKGLWHYASIPATVEYELLKRGINISRAEDRKKMFDVIESEYPYLKTTDKKHSYTRRLTSKAETSKSPGPLLIVR